MNFWKRCFVFPVNRPVLISEKSLGPGNREHRAKKRPEDKYSLLIAWI
jgi:hypothetical protein